MRELSCSANHHLHAPTAPNPVQEGVRTRVCATTAGTQAINPAAESSLLSSKATDRVGDPCTEDATCASSCTRPPGAACSRHTTDDKHSSHSRQQFIRNVEI